MARRNPLITTVLNHLPYRMRMIVMFYLRFGCIGVGILLAVFLFVIYTFLYAGIASSSEKVFRFPETRFAYDRMESYFKIYMYQDRDPGGYFQSPTELTGMYGSEAYFFKNIKESRFLTTNPLEAHLFLIPISWHQMRTRVRTLILFFW
jgi:hypothetical protein